MEEKVEIEQDNRNTRKIGKSTIFSIVLLVIITIMLPITIFYFFSINNDAYEERLDSNFVIKSIKPKSSGNYISNDETFIVKTSAANTEIVRNHLYIEPPVNYDIDKISKDEYEVSLENVPSDTLVNLSYVKDNVKRYSWAFQSTKDLKVLSVYPKNGASTVSTYTGISVVLSYPDVENFEEHFEISPKVDGTFSHIGKTWKFVPNKELRNDTNYTITITKGLKHEDKVLEESYTSTFSTYNRPENTATNENQDGKRPINHSTITFDGINTFTEGEKPTFKIYSYEEYKVKRVRMYKFGSYNDFVKFLNYDGNYNSTDLGDQEFTTFEQDSVQNIYTLNNKFTEGYYEIDAYLDNGTFYQIPVQISNMSAYLFSNDEDLVVWVGSGNNLLENIKVTYGDKTATTNEDGIAIIKKYNDLSDKVEYVNVGNDNNKLLIGVQNFRYIDYPSGYIYTDRPLYKNTDTVNVWGYVPIKFYKESYDDFKKQNFVIKIGEEIIQTEINDDGTFSFKYELDNHMDGGEVIYLYYKSVTIGSRYISIENYAKQNYEYKVDMAKSYVAAGKNFEFDIYVKHVSGVKVQNKSITAIYNNATYRGITDASGKVHFIIPTVAETNNVTFDYEYISIKTGDSEFNDNDFSVNFAKVNYNVYVKDSNYDPKTKINKLELYNISAEKEVKEDNETSLSELLKTGPYTGNIKVELRETYYKKVFDYTYYNKFTEKNVDIYKYETVYKKIVSNDVINVTDGKTEYKINYDLKNNTDIDHYSYNLIFRIPKDGKEFVYETYVYIPSENAYDYRENGFLYYGDFSSGIMTEDYSYYRYYMEKEDKTKYSIDDDIKLILKEYRDNPIEDSGKVLRLTFRNNILETKIFDKDDKLSSVFDEKSVPGIGYTGAFFLNGKFYRFPCYYFDFNEEDRKVDIEITTDKEEYNPKGEVILNIKTKDKYGNPIKTNLNISVVDKAVFNREGDYTGILSDVYQKVYYHAYTFSTFRDYEIGISNGGGMGDTKGGGRADFGDTIYFGNAKTDANGEAKVKIKLNDSVTTFVATVHATNEDVYLGANTKDIASTLPLAISVLEPSGLKTTDDVVISANSIGNVKEDINYTFEILDTNNKIKQKAKVGETVYANFGKLEEGSYKVKITAISGKAKDAIEFPFAVKTTQQEISVKAKSSINKLKSITPTKNPIILEFYKEGFSDYIRFLEILTNTYEDRLDTKVAYYKALEYENKYYGTNYPITMNDMAKFNNNGVLRYLENDNDSRVATALVAYYYPNLYNLTPDVFYEQMENVTDINFVVDNLLVLAAMKQSILDDLNAISKEDMQVYTKAKVALAYAFAGDYDSAKTLYYAIRNFSDIDGELAILATFIDKDKAVARIDNLYDKDNSNRYLYFAILSFFKNNETELTKESTIKVTYSGKEEEIKLSSLMMKKITINNKDLSTLTVESDDLNDMINYYYEGGIKEITEDNIKNNITISLSKKDLYVGQSVNLRVDLSKISGISGNMKIYLPNSMRLSGTVSGNDVYINANRGEYIIVYIGSKHSSYIDIPLYVTYPGNYKMEEVILKVKDIYYVSNQLDIGKK